MFPLRGFVFTSFRATLRVDLFAESAPRIGPRGVPRRGSRIGLPRTEVDHLALNDHETAADHLAAGLASLPAEQLGSEWVQEYKDAHERALERR